MTLSSGPQGNTVMLMGFPVSLGSLRSERTSHWSLVQLIQVETLPPSAKALQQNTAKDPVLGPVLWYTREGWWQTP